MSELFWNNQSTSQQEEYINLLSILGSLSHLFSDNKSPYLYYRGHENLFCEVFNAKNLSRGDISYDSIKDGVGVGLKTFLNNNGRTFQKVAEFNSDSDILRGFTVDEDIIYKVAELRNKRIITTQNMTDSHTSIYHLVTREPGLMNIIEAPMHLIDIDSIKIPKTQAKNTLKFADKYNQYSFSLSKNTLMQRFDTSKNQIITQFPVKILENPFDLLRSLHSEPVLVPLDGSESSGEAIILPLYSPRDNNVPVGSGLNQWNARGRKRDPDEVYIPIPAWIHDVFSDFFVYSRERSHRNESPKDYPSFTVELPNGKTLSCKVAQQGGKALMSNPNKALGKWILRDVLKLKPGTILTLNTLNELNIDSVKLTKKNDDYYYLDFVESGSYIEFEENNNV